MTRIPRRSSLAVTLLIAVLAACASEPGRGAKAEQGYHAADQVISALKYFRANRGAYPDSLDDLVPDYISAGMTVAVIKGETHPLEYQRVDDEYSLAFSYVGAKPTTCIYRLSTDWKCSVPG